MNVEPRVCDGFEDRSSYSSDQPFNMFFCIGFPDGIQDRQRHDDITDCPELDHQGLSHFGVPDPDASTVPVSADMRRSDLTGVDGLAPSVNKFRTLAQTWSTSMCSMGSRGWPSYSNPRFKYPPCGLGTLTEATCAPTGPQRCSAVGPLSPSVGTPTAAARCMTPVLTLTTHSAQASNPATTPS